MYYPNYVQPSTIILPVLKLFPISKEATSFNKRKVMHLHPTSPHNLTRKSDVSKSPHHPKRKVIRLHPKNPHHSTRRKLCVPTIRPRDDINNNRSDGSHPSRYCMKSLLTASFNYAFNTGMKGWYFLMSNSSENFLSITPLGVDNHRIRT